ncbi:MAG TPA: hypothetical protein VGN83_16885 [Falsiroseomonas sp.]|jgi:hypothetical protein|nr:hypothetical protein [Falsiroseomonas sp.]
MPNGRPGDSRHHDIVHHRLEVFGSSCDALVREISARLPHVRFGAFQDLIETWPFEDDGRPHDPDSLFDRLLALRGSLGLPASPAEPQARRGSPLAGLIGLVIGGTIGLPLGFLTYLVAREVVLPTELWSSDAVMWAIILAVVLGAALLGLLQGASPSRLGHALLIGLLGFALGSLVSGILSGVLAMGYAAVAGVSQREGAYAMGVVFGLMPVMAALGGIAAAIWTGRRAWRSWRRT